MQIETKYSLGDTVFYIQKDRQKEWHPCAFCEAQGTITGKDGTIRECPICHGHDGKYISRGEAWEVGGSFTIRQVEYRHSEVEIREAYMGGTEGGRIYYVENLWLTKEQAQLVCDQRNSDQGKDGD